MRARVQRWGNSLALRIPRSLAADAKLRQESEVDLTVVDGKVVITPVEPPAWTLEGPSRG
jgi:antitoxin MazE